MIPILSEPEDLSNNDILEACIFCNQDSNTWTIDEKINRPVCEDCAKKFDESDMPTAKYNY